MGPTPFVLVWLELVNAAHDGKLDVVKLCSRKSPEMNATLKQGWIDTALQGACEKGHLHIVKYLIEQCHASVHTKDKMGRDALQFACGSGSLNIVQYLVHEPIDYILAIMMNEYEEFHPLMNSSVNLLIQEFHIDVESRDHRGCTAMQMANENGHLDVVQYLIHQCHATL